MKTLFRSIPAVTLAVTVLLPISVSAAESSARIDTEAHSQLQVYKSPTCGCCTGWVEHMNNHGHQTHVHHPRDLNQIKNASAIPANARSCHTAISTSGFVFEGHIPAKYIEHFLANPPAGAKGLIVPAMPVGSPGMEYNDQFMSYSIMQLNSDGTLSRYARVDSSKDQM